MGGGSRVRWLAGARGWVAAGSRVSKFWARISYHRDLAGSSSSPLVSTATATTAVSWNDTRVGSTVGAGWEQELFPGWK
jgi:hypothetical protein